MGFFGNAHGRRSEPEALPENYVLVKASAKGYHVGPREVGDVFGVPRTKDGKVPKASWFSEVKEALKA